MKAVQKRCRSEKTMAMRLIIVGQPFFFYGFFATVEFMEIIRADCMGFCAGVRRAVMTANKALGENKSGRVYTFGPLIHNPVALKEFEKRGLGILQTENIASLKKEDTVVVRAHGVSPDIYEALKKTGALILDGTCPIVQTNQKKCADFAGKGYVIFFTGDKNHGEVEGIEGAARQSASLNSVPLNFFLIKSKEEAEALAEKISAEKDFCSREQKVVLMSQTTFSIKVFEQISICLKEKFPSLEVVKSICPATFERQSSLDKLCKTVEGILVIGGKNSANTTRLYKKALSLGVKAAHIETPDEIPADFFELEKIGLTAGASTPDDVIDEVENILRRYDKKAQ